MWDARVTDSIMMTETEYESKIRSFSADDFKTMDLQVCSLAQQLNQVSLNYYLFIFETILFSFLGPRPTFIQIKF